MYDTVRLVIVAPRGKLCIQQALINFLTPLLLNTKYIGGVSNDIFIIDDKKSTEDTCVIKVTLDREIFINNDIFLSISPLFSPNIHVVALNTAKEFSDQDPVLRSADNFYIYKLIGHDIEAFDNIFKKPRNPNIHLH